MGSILDSFLVAPRWICQGMVTPAVTDLLRTRSVCMRVSKRRSQLFSTCRQSSMHDFVYGSCTGMTLTDFRVHFVQCVGMTQKEVQADLKRDCAALQTCLRPPGTFHPNLEALADSPRNCLFLFLSWLVRIYKSTLAHDGFPARINKDPTITTSASPSPCVQKGLVN